MGWELGVLRAGYISRCAFSADRTTMEVNRIDSTSVALTLHTHRSITSFYLRERICEVI